MAHEKGVEIGDVVKSGPGLAYLVYPEVVLKMDPSGLWSCLFFLMLFTLGVSQTTIAFPTVAVLDRIKTIEKSSCFRLTLSSVELSP